ncbi:MAG: hypothetical protein HUU50_14450 [Candidatus Brocadiae bacterium]|nr:hypothetical protein [Candidatus Brocadiia bacterium]
MDNPLFSTEKEEKNHFWEYVDPFVESREQLENHCKNSGLDLLKRIGTGGFGSVYLVQDIHTGEKFALKVMDFRSHHSDIIPCFYESNSQIYTEVYVNIFRSLQEILSEEKISISCDDLSLYLVASRTLEKEEAWEHIPYQNHKLIQHLCHESRQNDLKLLNDEFIPGRAELFLLEIIDTKKLSQLTILELMKLAPHLMCEFFWDTKDACYSRASQKIFPIRLNITLRDLIKQSRSLFADHGKSLLREFFYDSQRPEDFYWKFSWLPQDLSQMNEPMLEKEICLNDLLQRYSHKEITRRFPEFFQIKVQQKIPAKIALEYLHGEKKMEAKRLLAVKNEVITANAMRQYYEGINQVLAPVQKVAGNILILSSFLYDASEIFQNHLYKKVDEVHQGERESFTLIAFPALITFLYNTGRLLENSVWAFGDIKQGNFKLNLAGQWEMIDYGGHFLKAMETTSHQDILGSNDYASYILFHILNAPLDHQIDGNWVQDALSRNSQWFSLVKVVVRMMSARSADKLRGTDLNRALFRDFQTYHESVFLDLIEKVLSKQDSPYHYRNFSLLKKDVSFFYLEEDNPGLETTLRRLLFIIGLSLCGYMHWSLLDEETRKKILVRYTKDNVSSSTWTVAIENDTMSITEYTQDACLAARKGLHPVEALKMMEFFFPGLKEFNHKQCQLAQIRKQILGKLQYLGIVKLDTYFSPPNIKYFYDHLLEAFATLDSAAWMDRNFCQKLYEERQADLSALALLDTNKEEIFKILQQSQPDMEKANQKLSLLLFWQRTFFNFFLGSKGNSCDLDLANTELFFTERWAKLKQAWKNKNFAFLKYAIDRRWIEKEDTKEIDWLQKIASFSSQEQHASVFMSHEIEREKEFPDIKTLEIQSQEKILWEGYQRQILSHPFFPPSFPKDALHSPKLGEFLQQEYAQEWFNCLSIPLQKRFLYIAEKLSPLCTKDSWKDLAICEELLNLWEKGAKALFQKIESSLFHCGCYSSQENFIQTHSDMENALTNIYQTLEQTLQEDKRFIWDSFFEELNDYLSIWEKESWKNLDLAFLISQRLLSRLKDWKNFVHTHFLFSTLAMEKSPLEHLYQKIHKLLAFVGDNEELKAILEKIQSYESITSNRKTGQIYSLYSSCISLIQEIEETMYQWNEFLEIPGFSFTTNRYQRYIPVLESIDDRILFKEIKGDISQGWNMDCLQNRICRFLSLQENFDLGMLQKAGIEKMLSWIFLQPGLLVSNNLLLQDELAQKIYLKLKSSTNHFQSLPKSLEDLIKIASYHLEKITTEVIQKRFDSLLPVEVQAPGFHRSVLLEFLEYQTELSYNKVPHDGFRKKILFMQLEREYKDLKIQYTRLLQEYPEIILTIENRILLYKNEAQAQKLLDEARQDWPKKIKIFSDYLKVLEWTLEAEKQNTPWAWRELLSDKENTFLSYIYPEMQNEELKDIYLSIFDLTPLPSLKDIKDFMKKCNTFQLSQEQKQELKDLLLKKNHEPDVFDKAKQYMDNFCWSSSEEEIIAAIEKIQLDAKAKEEFLKQYGQARHQLHVTQRITRETRFLNKLKQTLSEADTLKVFLFELWMTRFQKSIDSNIVNYFAEETDQLSYEKKADLYDALKRANPASDTTTLFLWLFSQYIFHPTLSLLDTGSFFGSKASEEILRQINTKFMHQEIPLKLQYTISKAIKEKKSANCQKNQILEYLSTIIAEQ